MDAPIYLGGKVLISWHNSHGFTENLHSIACQLWDGITIRGKIGHRTILVHRPLCHEFGPIIAHLEAHLVVVGIAFSQIQIKDCRKCIAFCCLPTAQQKIRVGNNIHIKGSYLSSRHSQSGVEMVRIWNFNPIQSILHP